MDHGDVEPSHLPTLNSLRVAKSKAISSELTHDDAITSLHIAKFTTPYQESIHDIGLNKFFVHYWTPNQINVYRQYHRQSKNTTLAIDATGGLVKKLAQPFGNKSGHLFLYQSVAVGEAEHPQFPVCQMISERHNNMAIERWLQEWLRSGGSVPKTAVCDRSVALLSGIVKAFTQYKSLGGYVTACYNTLFEVSEHCLPNCFVRCDVAHVIKNICSWLPLKNMSKSVRSFHIRCAAEIMRSENVTTLRTLLQAIFVVTTSPTVGKFVVDGHSTIQDTQAETARKYLKKLVSDDNFEQLNDLLDPSSTEGVDINVHAEGRDERESEETNPFGDWVKRIHQDCTKNRDNEDGDYDNALFCPQLVPLFIELVKDLPMISNVMRPFFKYGTDLASSAQVESTFNQIKNRLFSDKPLPLRIDSFVCAHINALDGELKLVAASSVTVKTKCQEGILTNASSNKVNDTTNTSLTQTDSENRKDLAGFSNSGYGKPRMTNAALKCPDCSKQNFPGGAHTCIKCHKSVHIIHDTCSRSISNEEGYGEKRICIECFNESSSQQEDFVIENWRGQGENTRQKSSSKTKKNRSIKSYLVRQRDIEHADLSVKKTTPLGILKNGNRAAELKPIHMTKSGDRQKRITTSNTCAFDSVAQILACTYCDSEAFKTFCDNAITKGSKFFKLCKNVACSGISSAVYRQRMEILIDIFCPTTEYVEKLSVIQCDVTIAQLLCKIMSTYPTATDSIECTCDNCLEIETKDVSIVGLSIRQPGDVSKLERELQIQFQQVQVSCSNPTCYEGDVLQCNGVKTVTKVARDNLFIELINTVEKDDTDITRELKVALADIPQTVRVDDKTFRLRGVIGFSAARKSLSEVGHYVAIAHRLNRNWELYDDCASKCKGVSSNKFVEVQVIVYTL